MTETAAQLPSPALRMSTARGRWVVTATVLGSGMAALDATVVGIAISAKHVPETKSPGPVPRLDYRGALAISGALAGITYGLIAASSDGWGSLSVLLPLGVGLVLLGVFILVEAREPERMLPLG